MTEALLDEMEWEKAKWREVYEISGEKYQAVIGGCKNCALAFKEWECFCSPDCGLMLCYIEVTDGMG